MENKTGKYFKYAIGEIVLVVIGILIALAINDWKNEKRIKSEETATLNKLVLDLKSDNDRLIKNIEFYIDDSDYLENSRDIIFKQSLSDNEIRKVMTFSGVIHRDLNPRTTTYNEMVNSGRIYSLSNDSLVNSIIEYYQFLDESIYQNKESRQEFRRLFYGSDFTDFWFWRAEEDPFPFAKVFFSNTDSPSYRILKQSSGWSVAINNGLLNNNKELLLMNNKLIESIELELSNK